MKPPRLERTRLALGAILLCSLSAFADDAPVLSSPTDVRGLLHLPYHLLLRWSFLLRLIHGG